MESSPSLAGPPMSALGVALIRARESDRPDRLYDDPHARTLVEAARTGFDSESWRRIDALAGDFYPGRTVGVRLVDDHVQRALDDGCTQIVLIGAGLDTRALRMARPGVEWFEVDLPTLFEFKEPALPRPSPRGRHVVAAGLRGDWLAALSAAGHRADLPTAWVEEGVAFEWDESTMAAITAASAPGSTWWRLVMNAEVDERRIRELRRLVAGPDGAPAPSPSFGKPSSPQGWSETFHRWDDLASAVGRPEACTGNPHDGVVESVRVVIE